MSCHSHNSRLVFYSPLKFSGPHSSSSPPANHSTPWSAILHTQFNRGLTPPSSHSMLHSLERCEADSLNSEHHLGFIASHVVFFQGLETAQYQSVKLFRQWLSFHVSSLHTFTRNEIEMFCPYIPFNRFALDRTGTRGLVEVIKISFNISSRQAPCLGYPLYKTRDLCGVKKKGQLFTPSH
ncbi:hypothetical protein RRG08_014644 [Elysia crispata]|uniref:Uncharacterized protein n=1 Tax=Elysia crispata TaxID=231223 RepID=A0AAE0YHL6_9GAST|nr:hypothetical protein RRG08_014644 [Elysia crispata]